jgi:DNA repair exonuclease SbcCD nuclease subunit
MNHDELRYGKQFRTFIWFMRAIRDGKRSIIISPDYVILSKDAYDELVPKTSEVYQSIAYDETGANYLLDKLIKAKK